MENTGLLENTGLTKNVFQEPVTRNRYLWADLVRIVAVFAVVAIHVNNFGYSWNQISWTDWWAANIYDATIRFAVPILFILSGYLLLDKQEDNRIFFSKRFGKVVIPLIAWSMIYMIFENNMMYSVYLPKVLYRSFLLIKFFITCTSSTISSGYILSLRCYAKF